MYTRYFGLKEKPFTIAPDPRYLYMSDLHREALAHLLYGIHNDGCLILLTGDVGTGKTTVCRCLLAQLPEKTDIAIILNPKLTIVELFKTICEELDVPGIQDSPSSKSYVDNLTYFGFGASGEKIYLTRLHWVEIYWINGKFERQFFSEHVKNPVSFVTDIPTASRAA